MKKPFPSLHVLWIPLLTVPVAAQQPLERSGGPLAERPSSHLTAMPPAPVEVAGLATRPSEGVLFDEPGDGSVQARGFPYKAHFDSRGATVIPYLGPDAPRNYPVTFRLTEALLDGRPLELRGEPGVHRDGHVVRIDHGAVVEEYELGEESLEQRFVLADLDARGELVLRMQVVTELERRDLGRHLRFENGYGRVDYGEAFAIDAAGRDTTLDSELVGDTLELRVPAGFVREAALPLVVDPFITFFTVAGGVRHEFSPDVSYDYSTDRWCIAWAEVFSATDYDVYVRYVTGNGLALGTSIIDVSSTNWSVPAIANNNASDTFLVCAAVVSHTTGSADIRGRIVTVSGGSVGSVIQISPTGGYRTFPDVGGDPFPTTQSYFCVVWQRSVSSFNSDVEYQMVSSAGALVGGVVVLDNSVEEDDRPAISNSLGLDSGDGTARWTIVWERRATTSNHDIWGAQVSWSGQLAQVPFPIVTSSWDETAPAVSSVLDPVEPGVARPYLVVCERDYGDHDLIGVVLQGPTPVTSSNLVGAFDPAVWYRDQRTPSVDTDGEQFLVGFDERATPGGPNPDVWMSSYYFAEGSLFPCELRKNFAGSSQTEGEVAVHSMASSAGPRKHYFGTWVFESLNNGYDVQGGLWDGCSGGLVDVSCTDNSLCPCGNTGASGHGCGNSVGSAGGLLSATGDASLGADTLVLRASGLPATAPCLFFQSVGNGGPFLLGDGLRCNTGMTKRFPVRISSGGVATYPGPSNPPVHVAGAVALAGQTRYYQAYYRDNGNFCTTATYNVTNGLRVIWAP